MIRVYLKSLFLCIIIYLVFKYIIYITLNLFLLVSDIFFRAMSIRGKSIPLQGWRRFHVVSVIWKGCFDRVCVR